MDIIQYTHTTSRQNHRIWKRKNWTSKETNLIVWNAVKRKKIKLKNNMRLIFVFFVTMNKTFVVPKNLEIVCKTCKIHLGFFSYHLSLFSTFFWQRNWKNLKFPKQNRRDRKISCFLFSRKKNTNGTKSTVTMGKKMWKRQEFSLETSIEKLRKMPKYLSLPAFLQNGFCNKKCRMIFWRRKIEKR